MYLIEVSTLYRKDFVWLSKINVCVLGCDITLTENVQPKERRTHFSLESPRGPYRRAMCYLKY